MTYRIFAEPSPGVIAHTAASRVLATDENLANFIEVAFDELLPAASRMVDAMERWPRSHEPNEAGFNIANATQDSMFAVMDKDPARARRFAGSMRHFLDTPAFSPNHLSEGFEWATVEKLVDVGGNSGAIAVELARKFPHLRCVVQDLPGTIETARVPTDVSERVSLMAHDFFVEQPVCDADVYLIRWVLHDWSDLYVAKILRAIVPAMKKDAKLIMNDSCLPEPGTMSFYDQRFLRYEHLLSPLNF